MSQILFVLGVPLVILVAAALQKRFLRLHQIAGRVLISYITVLLLLGAGELYFRYVYAAPEGVLARENWMTRYWHTNSLGFRDREWTPEDYAGKQTVLVVGDSFTAGWGLTNPADRFGDVLADRLGTDYAVINLGVPGASTLGERRTLQDYPVKNPNVVVLQYFLNDIEDAALSLGQYQEFPESPEWVRESYLANYFYWLNQSGFGVDYWAWEYAAYDNSAIWDVHAQQLADFVAYTDSIGARLVVVIFPNMQDPVTSIAYVDRVAQVLTENGVTDILKLFDAAAAWPVADRMVSPRDGHPSAAFHEYVGETLYQQFFASPASGNG